MFSANTLEPQPLVDSLRRADDPLSRLYRLDNIEEYYEMDNVSVPHDVPFLVSPSYHKLLYVNPLIEFWRGFGTAGPNRHRFAIIGYSLPSYDEYARMALYYLPTNSRGILGTSSKLKFVDYRQSPHKQSELKNNYSFIDWDTTDCYFDGFNMEAIKKIFDE